MNKYTWYFAVGFVSFCIMVVANVADVLATILLSNVVSGPQLIVASLILKGVSNFTGGYAVYALYHRLCEGRTPRRG